MMKKRFFAFVLQLLILFILGGCSSTPKDASNTLEITQPDEKIIQEYLDSKTNDISAPNQEGEMYSAFEIFGTDDNKIYVWMLKYEYLGQGKAVTNGVSTPIVLYIESKDGEIEIENHKSPKDGEEYGESLKKLFPQKVIEKMNNNHNDLIDQLEEIIQNRIKEDV
ncbi:hypothetical protein R0131_14465 [Clostridium sp. AL.422]|uniref:hypothetical protein n=1 Tax=Clostridium TaxID=1485 RepID=UPI00293DDC61|nr:MULTISPECIES: hypothetical protein [unclassified Clostridium]MDV4152029.1 hypothetical protein [Clostridium sp. AL.422]